jgi:hypothetical protein
MLTSNPTETKPRGLSKIPWGHMVFLAIMALCFLKRKQRAHAGGTTDA